MAVLKNGGQATDAVEAAIKLLEDREITNSGYGSNLTVAGTVECDATIVDHYGRSGAVGAVSRQYTPENKYFIDFLTIVVYRDQKPYFTRQDHS